MSRTNLFAHFLGKFRRLHAYAWRGWSVLGVSVFFTACGSAALPPPTYASAAPQGETSRLVTASDDAFSRRGHAIGTSAQTSLVQQREEARERVDHEGDEIDDESDDESGNGTRAGDPRSRGPHPLANYTSVQLRNAVRDEPQSLGPMSVGAPNGGALFNAVQLPEDPRWERVDASHAWGTQETVDSLTRAVGKVHEQFPDSPQLPIGHISGRFGGHLNPHRSHQAGTDVDVGFYYKPASHRWYVRGTRETLDLPRTWALVRAFITETDVKFILVDHSIQALLRQYAASIGEDEQWLSDIFKGEGYARPPLIRHAKGHATHLHVRFYSPEAEETGRRCYPALISAGKIKPATTFVTYKAKKGDTLLALAKRFKTTVKAIKRVNGLRSNTILAKRSYKIPSVGHAVHQVRPADLPARRLPPQSRLRAKTKSAPLGPSQHDRFPEHVDECDLESADCE